jgi:hypothetical protein
VLRQPQEKIAKNNIRIFIKKQSSGRPIALLIFTSSQLALSAETVEKGRKLHI